MTATWQRFAALALAADVLAASAVRAAPPRVGDDRYRLELVASDPEIVTPIGMAFDREGRLLVVESHTHKRTADYEGPAGDRVRMFADSDGDGQLDRWTTFADGLLHAMNILARPDGSVYVLARHQLLLLRDSDGDGKADERREIMHLETGDDYPHNGLGGIAIQDDGSLLVCMGENHGFAYTLTGSDGTTLSGEGGLDGVIHATADGGKLKWFAHGVWNPFSICVTPHGLIFAVDNDPDASPPCRLLHIVEGGDYGYLYQYGRAGTHPLQAWNGELPGTLPMVCGVGEAPTAIVAHAGRLWVTSWGDHRIEGYRLTPQGDSYTAEREVVVQGDADFRPTGMAVARDGSLYFGDWRRRDYEVHGTGRVWRLVLPEDEVAALFPPRSPQDVGWQPTELQAARWNGDPDAEALLREALNSSSPDERLFAVRWIADERIVALRDDVARLLEGSLPNARYYLAVLAAVDWLDRPPELRNAGINDALLVRELQNGRRSPEVHALALRLLSPDDPFLTRDRLREHLASAHPPLRLEAVRSLAQQGDPSRVELLAEVALNEAQSDAVRVEAIAGLAPFADQRAVASAMRRFLDSESSTFRREAERTLHLAGIEPMPNEVKPAAADSAAWSKLLAQPSDAASGRRLFFSGVGPRCSVCHRYDGRGGRTGPDLTHVGRQSDRQRIIASILQPSQEIAPHYQAWLLLTKDGKSRTGLRLAKAGDDGIEPYLDASGNIFTLPSETIEYREASDVSIMPDGLEKTLTIADLRNLVTFLADGDADLDASTGN